MASELIDGLAPSASSELKAYLKDCQNISKAIERINANPINVGGNGRGNNRAVIAEIEELNRKLAEQQAQIQRLTETRQRSNRQTQEEITNNGILAQNARQSVLANSQLAGAYRNLSAQQAISARRVQDLIARGRLATQTQREYDNELRVAQREFDRLNQRVVTANRAIGRFGDNVGNYPRLFNGLRDLIGAFGIVGGVTLFATIAKDIFNTTRELQGLDLALKNVTRTEESYIQTQSFLNRISEAYGIEIKGLTRSYTGFLAASQNAIDTGQITAKQIQDIFESVSKASGAMGLSVDEQQGAFLAIQQMMSKGKVSAEELTQQLSERLPGSFGILARALKVTEPELNKMLKTGQVLAADVLPAFARELERAYNVENVERVTTLAAETTRLGNAWTNFIRSVNEGEGVLGRVLTNTIGQITATLNAYTQLMKSESQRRKDLSQGTEQNSYALQKKELDALADSQRKAFANDLISSSTERLKVLEDENKALVENGKNLKQRIENWKNEASRGSSMFIAQFTEKLQENNKQIRSNIAQTARLRGIIRAANEALTPETQKTQTKELTEKELKELARLREEELQNQYRLQKLRLESESRMFEDIMNDTSLYYAKREEAANDFSGKEIAIAELTRKENLRRAGKNHTLQLIAWEEYYKDYEKIVKDNEARIKALQEKSFEEFQAWAEKYEGEGLRVLDRAGLREGFFKKQEEDAEALKKKMEELKRVTDDYLTSFQQDFFNNAGLPTLFKILNDEIPQFGENWATTFTSLAEVAQEAYAFINQTQEAYFQSQYARLEKERDLAIQYGGETEEAKAEINRQYEEKRRAIRRRELQQEKEAAIFNATIDTAQGVVASLAKGGPAGIALAAVIAALGAAQIALIASQPIPAYKHGTDNHKGGLALVGDGGKHEVVYQPSLGWSITPNKNTLVNLEKGSKVFPDLASSGIFNSNLPDMIQLNGGGLTAREMDRIMQKHSRVKQPAPKIEFHNHNTDNLMKAVRGKTGRV